MNVEYGTEPIPDTDGLAATITLNRPDELNALSWEMVGAFDDAVSQAAADPAVREELKALFQDHKGESDVHLVVQTSNGPKKLVFGDEFKVQPSPNLRYEIGQLLGADALAA